MLVSNENVMTWRLIFCWSNFITSVVRPHHRQALSTVSSVEKAMAQQVFVCLHLRASQHIGAKVEFFSLFKTFLGLFRTVTAECTHFHCREDRPNIEIHRQEGGFGDGKCIKYDRWDSHKRHIALKLNAIHSRFWHRRFSSKCVKRTAL